MKKFLVILSVICALALCGTISYAVAQTCSTISGASVDARYVDGGKSYEVSLSNYSGSRCSASYCVDAKSNGGEWERIYEGILTADNNQTRSHTVSLRGYDVARLTNVSTWKCN